MYRLGAATFPKRVPCIDWVQPLSLRGCHVSILAFQRNQFLQSFLYQNNTLVTHTKSVYISVISKCLKPATLQYDENVIWRFLKISHFGVGDLTLSYFPNQWTNIDSLASL